jgi:anion-transporting  ArsA/GET3 family ATPase
VVKHVERLMKTLTEFGLLIHGMVINCVIEEDDPDTLRALRRNQEQHMSELRRLAGPLPVALLPRSPVDIKGSRALRHAGELLCRQLGIGR